MNADGTLTEIPTSLKRLVRLVMRGFYAPEHAIVMDMLIRNPCMKEDDLVDLLKFERKQLRSVIAQLKNDRFVKVRLRMETGPDGKASRQNYYYISYKQFVNIVKYKLDHMRRKIEQEEKTATSRASFKCPGCSKTFTDLEADHLLDMLTGDFRCSYCSMLVEEDESALPKTDSRLLMARFNEQIEPLYNLLRELDDIKLAPELLEPEPTDLAPVKKDANGQKNRPYNPNDHTTWSGDATRNKNYLMNADQGITVNVGDDNSQDKASAMLEKKEQPVWMTHSTVNNDLVIPEFATTHIENHNIPSSSSAEFSRNNLDDGDIMQALLAHERKVGESMPVIPGQEGNEESSSESEDSGKLLQPPPEQVVEEMESDDDDDTLTVQVGNQRVPITEITEEHVAKMTHAERETYIRLTQDLYSSVYD